MQQLQAEIAQQTARYRQEQRKREMLESLREAQLSDYRLNQQRRQQATSGRTVSLAARPGQA